MDVDRFSRALDWNEVRFFIAVARAHTLAKAARLLAVDQTTVGRRIAALESKLQVALFARLPAGLVLTAAGERVMTAAERMEAAALELATQAVDDEGPVAGTVRIATTETLAEHFLIPAMKQVRAHHPNVSTVMLTGFERLDLCRGEADIAVRLVKPTDARLAFRKLADFRFRMYAARDYVARHPVESLKGHALLGYDSAPHAGGRSFDLLPKEGGTYALQANSGRVLVAAATAGLGIMQLPNFVGDRIPGLVAVLPDLDEPYRVWLVLPQSKRRVAAIRTVSEAIVATFTKTTRKSKRREMS